MSNAFKKMDKMYRHQRYFYDFTRKYYLLGRDKLIEEMNVTNSENILEVGCGTGRNLAILAKKHAGANFFGLDASAAMLENAHDKIDKGNLRNVTLQNVLADNFTFEKTFGLKEPFDTIYFSYSISMIPTWRESIQNALANLKNGCSFYIVDFFDQRDLPKPFQKILKVWLKQFHVKYPEELIPYLKQLEKQGMGKLSLKSIYKSYSFIVEFRKINE